MTATQRRQRDIQEAFRSTELNGHLRHVIVQLGYAVQQVNQAVEQPMRRRECFMRAVQHLHQELTETLIALENPSGLCDESKAYYENLLREHAGALEVAKKSFAKQKPALSNGVALANVRRAAVG